MQRFVRSGPSLVTTPVGRSTVSAALPSRFVQWLQKHKPRPFGRGLSQNQTGGHQQRWSTCDDILEPRRCRRNNIYAGNRPRRNNAGNVTVTTSANRRGAAPSEDECGLRSGIRDRVIFEFALKFAFQLRVLVSDTLNAPQAVAKPNKMIPVLTFEQRYMKMVRARSRKIDRSFSKHCAGVSVHVERIIGSEVWPTAQAIRACSFMWRPS
jgi:hypothetical protein